MVIRVSSAQVFSHARHYGVRAQARVADATIDMASGLSVRRPGDDPAAFAEAARLRAAAVRFERLELTTGRAIDELNQVDSALGSAAEAITSARSRAIQMANDTYSASDRAGAAAEIRGLLDTLTTELNVAHGGRYLLGGFQTDQPPFDPTGAYNGDTGVRLAETAPGVTEPVSIRADVAVLGVGGGVNVYSTLQALEAALTANDSTAIRATLDDLDTAIGQLSEARAEVGSRQLVFDAATAANRMARDAANTSAANREETDIFDGATRLAEAENAYQAMGAAISRAMNLSILDRM